MRALQVVAIVIIESVSAGLVGCGDDGAVADGGNEGGTGGSSTSAGNGPGGKSQTPPQTAAAVEAWLSDGSYKDWNCEDKVHPSRSPSPHGFNRICSNDLIADKATAAGDWPKGAAAVKELFASEDDKTPFGYAVYLKTESHSAGGDNWYWYERVPLDSQAPHDDKGVVADGMGDSGPAKTICVGCHVAAGSDSAHTPTQGGRDQVYTAVR